MRIRNLFFLPIALLLGLALAFSCAPPDDDDGGSSSTTSGTPSITSAIYDANAGALTLKGANLPSKVSDWDFTKLTIVGTGGNVVLAAHGTGANNYEGSKASATALTITAKGTKKALVAAKLNANGLNNWAKSAITYNLKAAKGAFKNSLETADLTTPIRRVAGVKVADATRSISLVKADKTYTTKNLLDEVVKASGFNALQNPKVKSIAIVAGANTTATKTSGYVINTSANTLQFKNGGITVGQKVALKVVLSSDSHLDSTVELRITIIATKQAAVTTATQAVSFNAADKTFSTAELLAEAVKANGFDALQNPDVKSVAKDNTAGAITATETSGYVLDTSAKTLQFKNAGISGGQKVTINVVLSSDAHADSTVKLVFTIVKKANALTGYASTTPTVTVAADDATKEIANAALLIAAKAATKTANGATTTLSNVITDSNAAIKTVSIVAHNSGANPKSTLTSGAAVSGSGAMAKVTLTKANLPISLTGKNKLVLSVVLESSTHADTTVLLTYTVTNTKAAALTGYAKTNGAVDVNNGNVTLTAQQIKTAALAAATGTPAAAISTKLGGTPAVKMVTVKLSGVADGGTAADGAAITMGTTGPTATVTFTQADLADSETVVLSVVLESATHRDTTVHITYTVTYKPTLKTDQDTQALAARAVELASGKTLDVKAMLEAAGYSSYADGLGTRPGFKTFTQTGGTASAMASIDANSGVITSSGIGSGLTYIFTVVIGSNGRADTDPITVTLTIQTAKLARLPKGTVTKIKEFTEQRRGSYDISEWDIRSDAKDAAGFRILRGAKVKSANRHSSSSSGFNSGLRIGSKDFSILYRNLSDGKKGVVDVVLSSDSHEDSSVRVTYIFKKR